MKSVTLVAGFVSFFFASPAFSDYVSMNSKKLNGKTQSECVSTLEQAFRDSGFSNVNRGKNDTGTSRGAFASDLPYRVGSICEGDVAFFYVSGPDLSKASELNAKIRKNMN